MPYVTSHLGVDVEFRHNGEGTPVEIHIAPSYVAPVWKPTEISFVTLNGKQMTAFEPHEKDDLDALEKLRVTMELDTQIPYTIYAFATVRLQRYQMELDRCKKALELAQESLREASIDCDNYDFGPAYESAERRQAEALQAVKEALKAFK